VNIDRWASRIYAEKDFGRSISTTLSGIVGLVTYLLSKDWTISAFVTIIVFPVFRILASALHTRWIERHKEKLQALEAQRTFEKFSPEERQVVKAFVDAGGATLSWSHIKEAGIFLPDVGVNSLIQRGVFCHTVTADGLSEAIAIDTAIFDLGQRVFPRSMTPDKLLQPTTAAPGS
jgi:hypothetical protein